LTLQAAVLFVDLENWGITIEFLVPLCIQPLQEELESRRLPIRVFEDLDRRIQEFLSEDGGSTLQASS
jgi:hypothetical protein